MLIYLYVYVYTKHTFFPPTRTLVESLLCIKSLLTLASIIQIFGSDDNVFMMFYYSNQEGKKSVLILFYFRKASNQKSELSILYKGEKHKVKKSSFRLPKFCVFVSSFNK